MFGGQFGGRALEEDFSGVDEGDVVASFGFVEVAGGDDDGDVFGVDEVVEDDPEVAS